MNQQHGQNSRSACGGETRFPRMRSSSHSHSPLPLLQSSDGNSFPNSVMVGVEQHERAAAFAVSAWTLPGAPGFVSRLSLASLLIFFVPCVSPLSLDCIEKSPCIEKCPSERITNFSAPLTLLPHHRHPSKPCPFMAETVSECLLSMLLAAWIDVLGILLAEHHLGKCANQISASAKNNNPAKPVRLQRQPPMDFVNAVNTTASAFHARRPPAA